MMTLDDLGFKVGLMVAGFSGAVVHAVVTKQTEWAAVVGLAIAGTLTANYLGPAAVHYFGTVFGDLGTAFLVGYSAVLICRWIPRLIQARLGELNGKGKGQ